MKPTLGVSSLNELATKVWRSKIKIKIKVDWKFRLKKREKKRLTFGQPFERESIWARRDELAKHENLIKSSI